ncbi:FAD-dependent monooxygenase [Noviherbaspirillum sedimenti]|uniref:2,4-dichlorophenol 6-monooxygenase n=1 Tax=Noviherbaspirillum sedimenti TaxID=2320865 RepID=A0A3A3G8P1_9BURK|nr:FAD-dependent monooxygenase [Noviherbaspirillum sedimenti]RJG04015.1 2,4-dichlorophenol 6-monooxygenase [Noviherbaspirillum sedimenti]
MTELVQVEVLVVGAGPAGASAAVFLGKQGIRTLMISRNRGTADTPRAHIVNQRTMEVFRDAGLEADCLAVASPAEHIANTFFLRGLAGEEMARQWAWGNNPARMGDVRTASPCSFVDFPQTKMEPIFIAEATRLGVNVRYDTELVSFEQDDEGVTATLLDRVSQQQFLVRAKYLIGADGANSRVANQLGLPLTGKEGLGAAYNVLCEMDLSAYTAHRKGSLYLILQPGLAEWAGVVVFRMVHAWDKWLVSIYIPPTYSGPDATTEQLVSRIRQAIADPAAADLPIKVLSTSKWSINDIHAEKISEGRVHCMGDAVHRHPPAAALGSNTCVQDGFNLAWKLALVLKGKAHPRLLDSFNAERQPVAKQIVARANLSMWQANGLADYLGACLFSAQTESDVNGKLATREGREALRQQLLDTRYNGEAHGVELTRNYHSGAIVGDDTPEPVPAQDPDLYYQPSTRPGSALPHGWLVNRKPGPLVSTLDLAGKGKFHLFSSHGGKGWKQAAKNVSEKFGVDIGVTLVGSGLDFEDPYLDWSKVRGTEDDGCVLVRPDLIVGWRHQQLPGDPTEALSQAMASILGWSTAV